MFNFADRARAEPPPERVSAPAGLSIDLADLLSRLRRRLWLVLACGVAAVAAALVVLPLLKPVYTAQVQILIDPADLQAVENGVRPTASLADSGVSMAESQVRVIGSDSVLSRVVTRLGLEQDGEFAQALPDSDGFAEIMKRLLGLAAPANLSRDPVLRAVEELRKRTAIRRPERTFVIEVTVRSGESDKAALIANTVAEVYFAQEAAARANSAGRISDALSARLSELRLALQAAEDKLFRFREANQLVATNGRLLADQRLGELNQQLTAAAIRVAEMRARAEQARSLRADSGTALPEMLQSTEMRALRQQLADTARLAAETSTRLGPRHPVVADQNAQIREIERTIAREKARIIDSTIKELDRAVAAEAAIRRELDRLKSETALNDRALIGVRELERDVEAQRTVYESYLRRTRETGQQGRLDTTNMRVISAATPPLGRSWPPSPKLMLPVALLLGLFLGTALALLLPAKRRVERSPVLVAVPPAQA